MAVNDLHLSVPSHCLDSKKQSIVTQELISRLESAQILIEYNFYLKAVSEIVPECTWFPSSSCWHNITIGKAKSGSH